MYLFIPNPSELDKYNLRVYSYWKHSQVPIQTENNNINWKCIFWSWLLGTCLLHPLLKTFQEICWCSLRIENKNCNFFLNPPPIIPDPDEDHILIGIRHGLGVKEYTSILRTHTSKPVNLTDSKIDPHHKLRLCGGWNWQTKYNLIFIIIGLKLNNCWSTRTFVKTGILFPVRWQHNKTF